MKPIRALPAALLLALAAAPAVAQVNLASGQTYSQNFDTLANTGTTNPWTDNATLPGWYSARAGGNAAAGPTTVYVANDGGSNAGAVYSYGSTGATERALGSASSGTPGTICNAVRVVNAGSGAITQFDISYTGEQWRNGGNTAAQPLTASYRVVAAGTPFELGCNVATGWTTSAALSYTSPTLGATAAALDGNAAANRVAVSGSLLETVPPGGELWLRFSDINDIGNDHGLAIDDVSISAIGMGGALPLVAFTAGAVSAIEGATGDANPLNFSVNVVPAPVAGSPVSFNIAVTGEVGRFSYGGPASLVVTDTTPLPLTITVDTVGNTAVQGNSDVTVSLSGFAGTAPSQSSPVAKIGTILEDDVGVSEIFDLQGTGPCTPLISPCNIAIEQIGPLVRTADNVVTYVGAGGFFMQTPDARADANPLTSNGIFVFTFGAAVTDGGMALAAGDRVEVVGEIVERFGYTQIRVQSTRNGTNSILRSATGSALPTAVLFGSGSPEVPSRDPANLSCGDSNFECFESMRVSMPSGRVAAPNQRFGTDLFAEVYASPYGGRGVREKGARFGVTLQPENLAAGVWDGNPEIIELDADVLIPANAGLELFGGAAFAAEGVIGFDFGDYEFWPAMFTLEPGTNVLLRPVPASSPDELTLGSFNAFRLCDAVAGNTTVTCSDSAAADADPVRVAHQVGQVSAYIRQVLRSPDVVGLQEVENLAVLTQLATQIATDGGPTYSAHLSEGNDVGGIDVGFLVNTTRVNEVTVSQLNGSEMWLDPGAGGAMAILHDRPPLLLAGTFIGNGRPFPFLVMNNHLRSRGGVDVSNPDGERLRAKRFVQARSIATLVQGLQTAPATSALPLILIGDFNAYQFTDAFVDSVGLIAGTYVDGENTCAPNNLVTNCKLGGPNIVTPALLNGVGVLDEDEQYSYNFTEVFGAVQGSASRDIATNQVLDHALVSATASPFVTGVAFGRGNVDASRQRFRVCNYTNRDLTLCPQGAGSWVPTGSSDHDGLVIFLAPPRLDDIFANGFEAPL